MLVLKNIVKDYVTGDSAVKALRGVSLDFRKSEFVSILGPSGCGKTTLLNIIGGLDRYTSGDLIIDGRSTKDFKDGDWDTYRNHSIGFVFQSYNLIPHQSVLANVELALTLSGVSRKERRARAIEALEKVGLHDQIHKRPNQLSGGQMQRVAIARALVNSPEILLCDEPTGALDTETSVQVMDILKEISKDKLIIMVTHNPELAETYSSRIIRILDGKITGDSDPYDAQNDPENRTLLSVESDKKAKKKQKKPSMSFFTALSLSVANLMTKKGRTFMTAFAGSIGIIGIALILSLSNGIQNYIDRVQEDTLSTYPLSILEQQQDMSAMMGAMTEVGQVEDHRDSGLIFVDDSMDTMASAMSKVQNNNLEKFREYMLAHMDELSPYLSDIQYTYNFDLQVFTGDGKTQVNPTTIFDNMGSAFSGVTELMGASGMKFSAMSEMIDNRELLEQQYELVDGEWPTAANELVLVISSNNQISKMSLYMLGVLDQGEIEGIMNDLMQGKDIESEPIEPFEFSDFIGKKFYLLNTSDFYEKTDRTYMVDGKTYPIWVDKRADKLNYEQEDYVTENGMELKITGILRPIEGAAATSISTNLAYTRALTEYILDQNTKSEIIAQQKELPEYNVLTGLKFERTEYTTENIGKLIDTIDDATMDTLYAYMTEQVKKGFVETPPVNAETFVGFVSVMNAEEQALLYDAMTAALAENPMGSMMLAGICAQLSTETLTVTPQNVRELLPILNWNVKIQGSETELPASMMLFVSLQQVCGEEVMTGVYDYMNAQLAEMSVTEDNFEQLLGIIANDKETWNTLVDTLYELAPQTDATQESNLLLLGDAELAKPASINFYAKDFASKDEIVNFITKYNETVDEIDQMKYTDMVGILMSSISVIIDVISYVLIAFVAISLVVSSIMIGIITYISVLERTKEIGILRAVGASKRDISRVFNAETVIVGFTAGIIGIGSTLLLCLPINAIIRTLTGISTIGAELPLVGGVALVLISVLLTLIAGLFPSRIAAKKDPVVALRSE